RGILDLDRGVIIYGAVRKPAHKKQEVRLLTQKNLARISIFGRRSALHRRYIGGLSMFTVPVLHQSRKRPFCRHFAVIGDKRKIASHVSYFSALGVITADRHLKPGAGVTGAGAVINPAEVYAVLATLPVGITKAPQESGNS